MSSAAGRHSSGFSRDSKAMTGSAQDRVQQVSCRTHRNKNGHWSRADQFLRGQPSTLETIPSLERPGPKRSLRKVLMSQLGSQIHVLPFRPKPALTIADRDPTSSQRAALPVAANEALRNCKSLPTRRRQHWRHRGWRECSFHRGPGH